MIMKEEEKIVVLSDRTPLTPEEKKDKNDRVRIGDKPRDRKYLYTYEKTNNDSPVVMAGEIPLQKERLKEEGIMPIGKAKDNRLKFNPNHR
jgi:hypothetical protein